MKKTIIVSLLTCSLITFTNCKKKSTQNNTSTNSAAATTNTSTGKVVITASWNSTYVMCTGAYNTVIGLGYSSTDVANEAYFAQSNYTGSSANFSKDLLAPGVYYYKAKKTYNSTKCGTGQGIPPVVTKSGAFTITAGQTTTVNAGSLN